MFATLIRPEPPDVIIKSPRNGNDSAPLVTFQVREPLYTPHGTKLGPSCIHTQTLMEHDFAFSYGQPFVGNDTAPEAVPPY